jgi:hypothetical protein
MGLAGAAGVGLDGRGGLEVRYRDQGFLGDGVGPDPLAGVVPAEPGLVAAGDVVDVEEDLVLALRCGLRAGSCWDGEGIRSRVSPSAMANRPRPARYSAKICRTTRAVSGSGSSLCRRLPSVALGLGCGPACLTQGSTRTSFRSRTQQLIRMSICDRGALLPMALFKASAPTPMKNGRCPALEVRRIG